MVIQGMFEFLTPIEKKTVILDHKQKAVTLANERRALIDDDDDIQYLDNLKARLTDIEQATVTTYNTLSLLPYDRSRKPNSPTNILLQQFVAQRREILNIIDLIHHYFPLHSGGFGAKGRAHHMDDEASLGFGTHLNGKARDDTFLSDIALNGAGINAHIYKPQATVPTESAGDSVIMGRKPPFQNTKDQLLQQLESSLDNIDTNQNFNYTGTPVGKDRGSGQFAAMGNTNATGYANLCEVPGFQNQRWEWLHLRGAGLGGATDSTNLVTGVRDANTHMIPFESNVRLLATAAGNSPCYSHLSVQWVVNQKIKEHAYQQIGMRWTLYDKFNQPTSFNGSAIFYPLRTNANISKNDVDVLEAALKRVRDTL